MTEISPERAEVAIFWAAANTMLDYLVESDRRGEFDFELAAHIITMLHRVVRQLDIAGVPRRRRHLELVK
jgi:hypothetical protein